MFPRKTVFTKFSKRFGHGPSEYGNIQQTFYAKPANLMDLLKPKPTIWSKNKDNIENEEEEKIEIVGPENYSYFVINTAVGVGAKGQNNIKRVHIRFRLISMNKEYKDPEVVFIYPHSVSESVGETEITEKFEKIAKITASLAANTPTLANSFGGKLFGGFKYGRYREELRKYILPYHVTIANASGTGSRAMWEFYQEEGMAAIGQFDLKIYFRIPKISSTSPNGIIKHRYCIDWNVEVNYKRLVDHDIDRRANWNMKVNGKLLMDKYRRTDSETENDNELRPDKDGYYLFWNVPVQNKTKDNEEDIRDKMNEEEVRDLMNEEDSEAEPQKLLRPLYLLLDPSNTAN